MRILVPLQTNIGIDRAHLMQVFKACEAFSSRGHTPTLLVPLGINTFFNKAQVVEALMQKYNIRHRFMVAGVPVFRGKAPFPFNKVNGISFALYSNLFALLFNPDVVFSRDLGFCRIFVMLRNIGLFRNTVFAFDVHDVHSLSEENASKKAGYERLEHAIFESADIILVLMSPIRDIIAGTGIQKHKIIVAPCGVDLSLFEGITKSIGRKRLSIPPNKKLVLYSGHLFSSKGVYTLAMAMKGLSGVECWMLGGLDEDRAAMRNFLSENRIGNVILKEKVAPREVPFFLSAADVVVVPSPSKITSNPSANGSSMRELMLYGTPMKLFEYMASGTPVVATDLVVHRQVLNAKNSVLVQPDSLSSMAQGIKKVLDNPHKSMERARNARKAALEFDWLGRLDPFLGIASRILKERGNPA